MGSRKGQQLRNRRVSVQRPRVPRTARVPAAAAGDLFQLKITLLGSKPPIWRRFTVPADIRLDKLHDVIQVVMGWSNSHLHQFVTFHELPRKTPRSRRNFDEKYYHPRPPKDIKDIWREPDDVYTDQRTLREVLKTADDRLAYQYDMGDMWEHDIELEKIIPAGSSDLPAIPKGRRTLPAVCIEGKLACPPDDCGGIYGYYDMLEAIKNPRHGMHEDMLEWLGDKFDPERFNLSQINAILSGARSYWSKT